MKDKKTRLWWADRLKVVFLVVFLLLAMLGYGVNPVFLLLEVLLVVAFLGVEISMNRCPHCDGYLDRTRGQFCQHCGERVREDKPDT